MTIDRAALAELADTQWSGRNELWTDPLGNTAALSDATIEVGAGVVHYTWSYEGKPQRGAIELVGDGVTWSDTWHQPTARTFRPLAVRGALVAVEGSYPAPPGPDWGWRIVLSRRPSGELVLQMTNVTPWGEDGRAVRLVATR